MKSVVILSVLTASALAFAGCRGVPAPGEASARHNLTVVAREYPVDFDQPALPELTADSSLSNYLAFALANSPSVQAAFYDWSAAVENITVARSRPDPQLTLQAYITDTLTSLMPGLAWNFPGPGKLSARGRAATAASEGKYVAFESAVLQTVFEVKKAYYNLALLQEQVRINQTSLALLDQLEATTRAQNNSSQGSLAAVYRVQSDRERLRSELASLADSGSTRRENFKAVLGLTPAQPDPPVPAHFEISQPEPDPAALERLAFARNPQLQAMAAEVRGAEAGIATAYRDRLPDFNAGVSAEVYAPPFFWPQAGMTLPIWRDKLAAELAQAQAGKLAAEKRWQAAQITLAVTFAEQSFTCRETARSLALTEDRLLPLARQSLALARAGYQAGTVDFASLTEAERLPLELELTAAQARIDHALALAELTILIAGVPPPGTPIATTNP